MTENIYKIYRRNKLKSGKIELFLCRDESASTVAGSVYHHTIFAGMIEGEKETFQVYGKRSHSIPITTNCQSIIV